MNFYTNVFFSRQKISNFCHVDPQHVINIQDQASIYHVPLEMVAQNVVELIQKRLEIVLTPIRPRYVTFFHLDCFFLLPS